ncbi:hypothetical protein IRZ71_07405 [Flavobacterium sp. ANB]|uniref:hypothetical protein n=1 Tax=unclassified Flavobacterium TaxID=196869 RepID=UPI0012B6EDDB|nr:MULTISPECIES: hypothetical protein [unclassified Flavobacterium]MBF4516161.1 hypothetical protein [Flavobacterium sp. ANB]MTD69942.1 hypothetical protein [Flavobacterium sp. LC2016-13]
MTKLFLIIFLFMFISCSPQDCNNVVVTINNTGNYYFKKEKLMAITSAKNDSISLKYKDTLLIKVEKYKVGKLVSEANFLYDSNNKISDDYIFSEDYHDYFEKFYTRIPYKNKYKLLDRDFVYIDNVLDEVQDWKKYCNDKKEIEIFEFKLDENVRMLNAKFSPFIYGTMLKNIKLHVANNFLVEIEAILIEEPDGETIYYKRYYDYDKTGRLISSKTINSNSGQIEDQEKIEYRKW